MHATPRLFARLLPLLAAALAAQTPALAQGSIGFDDEVFLRVNQIRRSAGLRLLARNRALDLAAQVHAEDMARYNFMSHFGSNGSSPAARIRAAGYPWINWAENVAVGYATPAAVMNGWMNSPGHRRNILNANLREIGIGFVRAPGTGWRTFWCQDFGTRRGGTISAVENTPEPDFATGESPTILDSSPDAGPSGTVVVIVGRGFGSGQGACLVLYGVQGTARIESWTDTRIVVVIENAQPGPGSIRVCTSDGQTSNPTLFTVKG
jgi:uncharacterized protein YkwD